MLTVDEIEERVSQWNDELSSWYRSNHKWDSVEEHINSTTPSDINGLSIRLVEQYGGEGQGDDYWIVMEISENGDDPRLYRVNGYHRSYDGSYLDGELFEVTPKTVQVIRYERVD